MKSLIKPLLIAALIIIIALSIASTIYMRDILKGLPSLSSLKDDTTPEYCDLPTSVYSNKDELIAAFTVIRQRMIDSKDMPRYLTDAVILTNDPDFYQRKGINLKKIISAFPLLPFGEKDRIRKTTARPHYTITEELLQHLFSPSSSPPSAFSASPREQSPSPSASPREPLSIRHRLELAILTMQAEKMFTKKEILSRYMNRTFLGHGNYGVEAASRCYFRKAVKDLTLSEVAILTGLFHSPEEFSPFIHPDKSAEKQKEVLAVMVKAGCITQKDSLDAIKGVEKMLKRISKRGHGNIKTTVNNVPYFVDYIMEDISKKYGNNAMYKKGLKVYTTLDLGFQRQAETVLEDALVKLNKNNQCNSSIEGALIALDPTTGQIKAMVGGSGVTRFNRMNRAVYTRRQPGSTFKPFIYTAAIDSGFTTATLLNDSEVSYGKWTPKNYEDKFLGTITLRYALEQSINVASIKLLNKLGTKKAIDYARRMGIESKLDNDLTLCLGVSVVTPLEIAGAYIPFANNGIGAKPMSIRYTKDYEGNLLNVYLPKQKQAISPQTAYIMLDMLKGVVERGTARGALHNRLRIEAAGKTGTSNDCADAWFIGFIPQLLACVWVGHDKGQISMGEEMCGGKIAAPIWRDFMLKAIPRIPPSSFQRPSGIVEIVIDPFTGMKATQYCPRTKKEIFISGTEPKGSCTIHIRQRKIVSPKIEARTDEEP
ncbi:transglycosylase domain-containing protein [bacterium]|nr:transglycosylase domain-containing protein [bacterium]MBU1754152.1 transglycosylase domain-containing protein [bacterium]